MSLFDRIYVVDWSARSSASPAKPSADAIWIGGHGAPRYFRTRSTALDWLHREIAECRAAGLRVLVGFDFAFSYPVGFARVLTGEDDPMALWALLSARIKDGVDNANNRFAVAAEMNRAFPGIGPFWGCPSQQETADLPAKGTARHSHGLSELRVVETLCSAQSVWKLYTTGAVGSQALLGIAALEKLRVAPAVQAEIWPLQTGFSIPKGAVVFCEIYPSLYAKQIADSRENDEILDAAQVRITAQTLTDLDAQDALPQYFEPDTDADPREGWILGLAPSAKLKNDCFALPPGTYWTPVDEALARLQTSLTCVCGVETVPVMDAVGRVLATDIQAHRDSPPHANSAVDGYGVNGSSTSFHLLEGRSAAGVPYRDRVPAGYALRILTGAKIPVGVDRVVLQEDVAISDKQLQFGAGLKPGANIRRAGEDSAKGDVVLPAKRVLTAQDLAVLTSVGVTEIRLRRRLKVAVMSTGDEVVACDATPNQIYDANRPMLLALLERWGFEAIDLGIIPDTADAVKAALSQGAQADAILTTGGASAGDEDHVSACLRSAGQMNTWRVALKPGRPLALGLWDGTPVFGLPGNPVAAFVCALIFARPAALQLAGADWTQPEGFMVPSAFTKRKKAGRREYLRARLRDGRVEVFGSEGSGRVSGLSWADGLCELPDEAVGITPGSLVRFHPFGSFGL